MTNRRTSCCSKSSWAIRVARNSALLLGANDFLTKPLDRTEVVLRVRNLLHMRALFADLEAARLLLERNQKSD